MKATDPVSFDEGFKLGAKVEYRAALEAAANALLDILGKDAGDGIINLGAAGHWVQHGDDGRWRPAGRVGWTSRERR